MRRRREIGVYTSARHAYQNYEILTGQTLNLNRSSIKSQLQYGILVFVSIVLFSSAWTGLEEEATVDEEEAVRISQRGASRVGHDPEKKAYKDGWQQPGQTAFSDVVATSNRFFVSTS